MSSVRGPSLDLWSSGVEFLPRRFGQLLERSNAHRDDGWRSVSHYRKITAPSARFVPLRRSVGSGDVFGASRLRLYVSAQNIFNTDPPFLNDGRDAIGYDPENGDLLGRRVSLNADVRW